MTESARELARRLELTLGDESLLELALVHPSRALEVAGASNQRLEFLGDAVVGLVVGEALFLAHPDLDEGQLSKARIALVNESILAELGRQLGLSDLLAMGKGAARSGDAELDSVLADAFEAVVGAVYLAAGLEEARRLVLRQLGDRLEQAAADPGAWDYKSRMNEWAQAHHGVGCTYEVERTGPEHRPRFLAVLTVGGRPIARGEGRSRKQAEAAAARAALEEVGGA
jgi:ribonuclease III